MCRFYHTLSVTKSGSLYTWGDGKEGKLGHNDDATRLLPTLVSEFMDRVSDTDTRETDFRFQCFPLSLFEPIIVAIMAWPRTSK